ncbi:hypothetical protein [Actinomadura sp. DC4]|uniref:hypothetical protein n=1 Tax=Actinomadura sp. DC4 TaxID=3055069 RepID=UPI0025AF3405|nr:hypothetical protein [Actinomadura sp. DC4]MDN3354972.1 hypothetical protein [Actinomadura sp. DC4]
MGDAGRGGHGLDEPAPRHEGHPRLRHGSQGLLDRPAQQGDRVQGSGDGEPEEHPVPVGRAEPGPDRGRDVADRTAHRDEDEVGQQRLDHHEAQGGRQQAGGGLGERAQDAIARR